MAASKSGFMKDALILFAITLISGVCLGFVYDITKAPIERATIEANNRTYKEVLSTAAEFLTQTELSPAWGSVRSTIPRALA